MRHLFTVIIDWTTRKRVIENANREAAAAATTSVLIVKSRGPCRRMDRPPDVCSAASSA